MLRELYQTLSREIVARFKERDDKIQAIVLNTFAALVRSSFLTNTAGQEVELTDIRLVWMRSSVEELEKQIDDFMGSLLKIISTKN